MEEVYAAGTVPWRKVKTKGGKKQVQVLLVYRAKYADWSFPKGKLDPEETLAAAAVRETFEETGLRVSLGCNLGKIEYRVSGGRQKTVQYWAARATKTSALKHFQPNDEIAQIRWLSLKKAAKQLSYARDRELLGVFKSLVAHKKLDTFAVVLLRHAKAEPRGSVYPVDSKRPLDDFGAYQAQAIVPQLRAFKPKHLITSDAKRCRATITPLAYRLHRSPDICAAISQDTWDTGDLSQLQEIVQEVLNSQENTLLCSHRPVLPDIAREFALQTRTPVGKYLDAIATLPPAGFAVLHITRRKRPQLVSVESYPLKYGGGSAQNKN